MEQRHFDRYCVAGVLNPFVQVSLVVLYLAVHRLSGVATRLGLIGSHPFIHLGLIFTLNGKIE